jgi:hypothetical protein
MWLPSNPDKIPRLFLPCPSNDEYQLEPGMLGLKDTGEGTELWCRPPRVNSGDPEPDPFLVATAEDINSLLALINSHASRHENGGSDEIDVTGLSGVLADAQTPSAHASTHEAGGSDEIDAGNLSGTGAVGNSFTIDDAITGNPAAKIEQRDITLIKTITAGASSAVSGIVVDSQYIITVQVDDYLTRYDRHTGKILERYSGSAYWGGKVMLPHDGLVLILADNLVTEVNRSDFESFAAITATGLVMTSGRAADVLSNMDIYSINLGTNQLQISSRGASSYSVTNHTLSGFSNNLYGLCFDPTETYFYVVDSGVSGCVIRKYDVASRTLQASSSTIPGSFTNLLQTSEGRIIVGINSKIVLLDLATLTTISAGGSVSIGSNKKYVYDGLVYDGGSALISIYQIQSLTLRAPSHLDGAAVQSSAFLYDGDLYNHKDWCRASKQLTSDRYNNYIDLKRSGQFVVPSGTATGYFDITISGVLGGDGDEVADLVADVSLFVDREYVSGDIEAAQSNHIGPVSSVLSTNPTASWEDTLQPNNIPWLTTVEQQAASGTLTYRVSWDATSRAADQIVRYHVCARGPVWPFWNNPS